MIAAIVFASALATAASAQTDKPPRPDQVAFREIYRELVETNTTQSAGSCTEAAHKMGARLEAAGYAPSELTYFSVPAYPQKGGLVAILKGSDPKAGAVLLLGHLDVVEARREDWPRDPFKLVEENGYFIGRGTVDMKVIDAIWVDAMMRLKTAGKAPARTLKMALTCGEEGDRAFNGAEWLVNTRPELVKADFALNEGGGAAVDANGRRDELFVQAGEKANQHFHLTVTNPGGHSSIPRADNAIFQLTGALEKLRAFSFPVRFTDTTRMQLARRAAHDDAAGEALKRLMADPADREAARVAQADPWINAFTHTTCVPTLLSAGHAQNALPQTATANVNCRIFPGETIEGTRDTLVRLIGDPQVKVEATYVDKPVAVSPPLDPKVIGPMKALAARHFPGVPLTPLMLPGATDGVYFAALKMPVYGVPGLFTDPDGNGVHGLNERVRVKSVYDFRDYLLDLVETYVRTKADVKPAARHD